VPKDDDYLANLVRAIRRELARTQIELASGAGVPLNDVKRIEAGRAAMVRLGRIRQVLESADGRLYLSPWWHGAAADRLLDERHAELVEHLVALMRARGWEAQVEVTFNEWGERGSIDVLAWHPLKRARSGMRGEERLRLTRGDKQEPRRQDPPGATDH
jgi:hypothetical protein